MCMVRGAWCMIQQSRTLKDLKPVSLLRYVGMACSSFTPPHKANRWVIVFTRAYTHTVGNVVILSEYQPVTEQLLFPTCSCSNVDVKSNIAHSDRGQNPRGRSILGDLSEGIGDC